MAIEKILFRRPVRRDIAKPMIESFIDNSGSRVHGVGYMSADMINYIRTIFPSITSQQPNTHPLEYDWGIGKYYGRTTNGDVVAFVVPVLIHQGDPVPPGVDPVMDFINHPGFFNPDLQTAGGEPHFFYNEGHLFP